MVSAVDDDAHLALSSLAPHAMKKHAQVSEYFARDVGLRGVRHDEHGVVEDQAPVGSVVAPSAPPRWECGRPAEQRR